MLRSGDGANLPMTFSKDEPSNFLKIKTDFNLLYSFSRYGRLKKGTISKNVEFLPKFRLFFVYLVALNVTNFHNNHIKGRY